MERHAIRQLGLAGIGPAEIVFEHSLNMCYPGQTFDMSVPVSMSGDRLTQADLEATIVRFHDLHEETHTYASRDEEPVLRGARLHAVGPTPKPALTAVPPAEGNVDAARKAPRKAYFDGSYVDTPVYDGDLLGGGHRIVGPAIIEEAFTTIVLNPGDTASLDAHGNYLIHIGVRG
jgi:N-methylhydantoinase A